MTIRPLVAAGTLAVAFMSFPALAESQQSRVDYADLDLTQQADRQVLDQRVKRAAHSVCRFDDRGQIVTAEAEFICVREAVKQVAPAVVAALSRAQVRFAETGSSATAARRGS